MFECLHACRKALECLNVYTPSGRRSNVPTAGRGVRERRGPDANSNIFECLKNGVQGGPDFKSGVGIECVRPGSGPAGGGGGGGRAVVRAGRVISCAGAHSDRIARCDGRNSTRINGQIMVKYWSNIGQTRVKRGLRRSVRVE